MSKTQSDKIILRGGYVQDEQIAEVTINPGYLLKRTPAGVNITDAGSNQVLVAVEMSDTGKSITDAYSVGDQTIIAAPQKGSQIQLKLAAGATAIQVGDKLEASFDGTVTLVAGGFPLAGALQAVDNSAGTEEVFINAEVL
jgi:hypothetical protein